VTWTTEPKRRKKKKNRIQSNEKDGHYGYKSHHKHNVIEDPLDPRLFNKDAKQAALHSPGRRKKYEISQGLNQSRFRRHLKLTPSADAPVPSMGQEC
jgi:hypothetical protein